MNILGNCSADIVKGAGYSRDLSERNGRCQMLLEQPQYKIFSMVRSSSFIDSHCRQEIYASDADAATVAVKLSRTSMAGYSSSVHDVDSSQAV